MTQIDNNHNQAISRVPHRVSQVITFNLLYLLSIYHHNNIAILSTGKLKNLVPTADCCLKDLTTQPVLLIQREIWLVARYPSLVAR